MMMVQTLQRFFLILRRNLYWVLHKDGKSCKNDMAEDEITVSEIIAEEVFRDEKLN